MSVAPPEFSSTVGLLPFLHSAPEDTPEVCEGNDSAEGGVAAHLPLKHSKEVKEKKEPPPVPPKTRLDVNHRARKGWDLKSVWE